MAAEAVAESAGGGVHSTRVMTMNVLAPQYADPAARRAVLARELHRLRPDVLALQEVGRDELPALAGDGWHLAPHPRWSADGVGAVLAARRPFGHVTADPLQVTGRTARTEWCGAVAAELPLPEPFGTLLVVHHKPSWPYDYEHERELQALAATRLAEQAAAARPVRHTVLLGDLDATPDAASLRFLRGLQTLDGVGVCFQDAWSAVHPGEPGPTFGPGNPLVRQGDMPAVADRRIDHILVRCGSHGPTLRVSGCERVLVQPVDGVQASDHYGLLADLTLPDHPPGRWALQR
ncbi:MULTISPECIES: endonuclease/exonuclease/phosphatase family protein [Streptomyces]|uniref:endonuclease/exonuclease/phosphatase family protein n=1 Tax=Streptomyces TaxID=1883 RepID=UPI000C39F4DB|nr:MULTISPECIES: endonuclease/exonuclease/phosphatase family protein [unclassified Streptomyces]MBQ0862548.1 endonuclease/exonuclease/phosphatase family protein [Streptomyces sp. RK75]MBQ1123331.1 endonuclease/exonuclease/phosphatase family protein [Streptomyces sp. B15]